MFELFFEDFGLPNFKGLFAGNTSFQSELARDTAPIAVAGAGGPGQLQSSS